MYHPIEVLNNVIVIVHLLLLGHLVIRIHEKDSFTVSYESESCLVTCNTLVSKVLEDLLQSCLCYTVFLNSKASLFHLKLTKEPADSLLFLGNT